MAGPGVVVQTKNQSGETPVLVLRHLAITPCLVIELDAPWGGFTVVDCG